MAVATPDKAVDVHHLRHAVVIYFFGICVCFFFITDNCYVCLFFYLLGWLCSNCWQVGEATELEDPD